MLPFVQFFCFQNDHKMSLDQTSDIENYSNIDIQSSKLIQCKYQITHITHTTNSGVTCDTFESCATPLASTHTKIHNMQGG